MISNRNLYIVSIIISIPFILWAILQILPTFDDWTTLSLPNYDPDYLLYILPFGMTWRPGDAIWGYINAIDYQLYPALNHVMIFIAHICSTFVIYKLTEILLQHSFIYHHVFWVRFLVAMHSTKVILISGESYLYIYTWY